LYLLCKFIFFIAVKGKLEIVSGVAPPHFRIFAGALLAACGGEMSSDYFKNTASVFDFQEFCRPILLRFARHQFRSKSSVQKRFGFRQINAHSKD